MTGEFYSVDGFWEDFFEQGTAKYLGRRTIDWPTRRLGSPGMIDVEITETIVLDRNMKRVRYKATIAKPIKARAIQFALCGRMLKVGDRVEIRRTAEERLRALAPQNGLIKEFLGNGVVKLRFDDAPFEWTEEFWRLSGDSENSVQV
jgi:hypothetical protein